ncbi:rhodanese-like domain-containing protein, partial [Streptomyces sp. NPDC044948]
ARRGGEEAVVLDVRRDAERARGWVRDSVHLPVHEVHRRLGEVPPGTVWVHCAGGMRAAIAASVLDAAGREVVAVDDGFAAAAEAGLPLVTPSDDSAA